MDYAGKYFKVTKLYITAYKKFTQESKYTLTLNYFTRVNMDVRADIVIRVFASTYKY